MSDHSVAHQMQLKPIADLKTAIGINEKFQFINELFEGQTDKYNAAINNLNSCTSAVDGEWQLQNMRILNNWEENNETYKKLKVYINRRYL